MKQQENVPPKTSAGVAASAPVREHDKQDADQERREGRSTGSVITVSQKSGGGGLLQAVVLGDSGFMVLSRDSSGGWGVRQSIDEERIEEQQHYFNNPFQLGTLGGGEVNTPADALRLSLPLSRGDLVLLATDGLFDTLFEQDIEHIVDERLGEADHSQQEPQAVAGLLNDTATALVDAAQVRSNPRSLSCRDALRKSS